MSRRSRGLAILVSLIASGAIRVAAAQSPAAEPLPDDLQGVGITQRLDARLPLEQVFRDEEGRTIALGEFFAPERPVVLALVYYRCPMLCGLVLGGLTDALRGMDWAPGAEFEVVTVSIDPRETAELAAAKKRNQLEAYGRAGAAAGWHFLTGEAEAIAALADAVGFRYRYLPDSGEFAHAAALFVITPQGRVSRYLFGVQHDPQTLRLSLVEAAEGRIGSVVDQFLLYCYRYDPQEGRYVPVAWKIMRLGGALTVVVLGGMLAALWWREARQRRKRLA